MLWASLDYYFIGLDSCESRRRLRIYSLVKLFNVVLRLMCIPSTGVHSIYCLQALPSTINFFDFVAFTAIPSISQL